MPFFINRWIMRLPTLSALVALLSACSATESPLAPTEPAGIRPIESNHQQFNTMSTLEITLNLSHAQVLSGECTPVEVILTNTGPDPVEVPSPDSPMQFEFMLAEQDSNRGPLVLSRANPPAPLSDEFLPPLPLETIRLGPGEELHYTDDLSDFVANGIPEADYQVVAVLKQGSETVRSKAATLNVVKPAISQLATAGSSGTSSFGIVFLHAEENQPGVVYQSNARMSGPPSRIWYRRATLSGPFSARDRVALAYDLGGDPGVRWYAWQEGAKIGAGIAEMDTVFVTIEPVPIELVPFSIQETGWQLSVEEATFVAIGKLPAGGPGFTVISFLDTGEVSQRSMPIEGNAIPRIWQAAFDPESGSYHLVMVLPGAGVSTLSIQTFTPSSGTASPARSLGQFPQAIRALSLCPEIEGEESAVDVLLQPVGPEGETTVVRIPIAGGEPQNWTFTAAEDKDHPVIPSDWMLASPSPDEGPVIVARLDNRLVVRRVDSGSSWSTLASNAGQLSHVRLEYLNSSLYAVWVDPLLGVRLVKVP